MKNLLLIVVAILLILPRAQAQSLALGTPATAQQSAVYTPVAFSSYHAHHETATITKVGTIMAGAGIITGAAGAFIAINALVTSDGDAAGPIVTGAILFVVGGAVGITGGVLSMVGLRKQHHGRYGFNIVAPKSNQLGVAYNF